jgi:hypothetical protein
MDPVAGGLRKWGLIGGAIALVAALGIATYQSQPQKPPASPAATEEPASAVVPLPPQNPPQAPEPAAPSAEQPVPKTAVSKPKSAQAPAPTVEVASAENPTLEFIIRVSEGHPLFAAQTLYENGQRAEAGFAARSAMAQNRAFNGLCFENFTYGAEIVVSHCAAVSPGLLKRTGARWAAKLRAMPGTAYAEENVILHPEAKGPATP